MEEVKNDKISDQGNVSDVQITPSQLSMGRSDIDSVESQIPIQNVRTVIMAKAS
jgi:hypothetical protein